MAFKTKDEYGRPGCSVNCGCGGCLVALVEIGAFILICKFCGCGWAGRVTDDIARQVHGIVHTVKTGD